MLIVPCTSLSAVLLAATKIAVVPSHVDASAEGKVPGVIDEYVLTAVQNVGGMETVGSDDITAVIGFEQQKQLMGCDDAACFASLGGALGVEKLVIVKVALADSKWAITAKLVNTGEARVENRVTDFVSGDSAQLLAGIDPLIKRLFTVQAPPVMTVTPVAAKPEPGAPLGPPNINLSLHAYKMVRSQRLPTSLDELGNEAKRVAYTDAFFMARAQLNERWYGKTGLFFEIGISLALLTSVTQASTDISENRRELNGMMHAVQSVHRSFWEGDDKLVGLGTERLSVDFGGGGFAALGEKGEVGLLSRTDLRFYWFHVGAMVTYGWATKLSIGVGGGVRLAF
ncbi:MAG: hypothetical protein HY903_01175 [Deltaproteobacteria bacterium]|nr:hypothetical protein [Deltaproteobacteria bacterium]